MSSDSESRLRTAVADAGEMLQTEVIALISDGKKSADRPGTLFHFTDPDGLIGILQSKCLRASLATALNDPSEVQYGVSRACELARRTRAPKNGLPRDLLEGFLTETRWIEELRFREYAYVVSFCGRVNQAVHWLHYGRAGTGVAMGFDSGQFQGRGVNLLRVLYDETAQDELLAGVFACVDRFVERLIPAARGDAEEWLFKTAAHLCTHFVRVASVRMKNPAFAAEDEWRLVSFDTQRLGARAEEQKKTNVRFRCLAGRIVPYLELEFEKLALKEIVLGGSSLLSPDEESLILLLQQTVGSVPISRSSVPVRP